LRAEDKTARASGRRIRLRSELRRDKARHPYLFTRLRAMARRAMAFAPNCSELQ